MGLSPPTSSVRITSGRAAQQIGDLLVAAQLLGFVGRGGALEEQELGAQQAAALGALRHGVLRVGVAAGEIREHFDALATGEVALLARGTEFARTALARLLEARARRGQFRSPSA